jgi:hypothetical protein
MSHRLLSLALLFAFAASAAACDVRGFGAATSGTPTVGGQPEVDAGSDAAESVDAAGEAPSAVSTQGSPLCNAQTASGCYPDQATTAKACDEAPDGGAYNAASDYGDEAFACRVVASSTSPTGFAPVCALAGTVGNGLACKVSSDCLPTFDCVGSGDTATCQRYCCSGNVECAATEFCDIQPTAQASAVEIPVCMPIVPAAGCELLGTDACPSKTETCAVVRENGLTGCVAVGTAKAHQSCDETHCAAGLTCLGTVGQRECYQLCHTASTDECTAPETCKGGLPLFPDPAVGICQ